MSDSDDTDVLLLIPPDFFVVGSSDSEEANYVDDVSERSVVSDLISQVNQLEDRVCQIENKDIPSQSLYHSLTSMNSSNSASTSSHGGPLHSRYGNSGLSTHRILTSSDSNLNLSPSRKITRFNSLPPTPSSNSSRSNTLGGFSSRADGHTHYLSPKKNAADFNTKLASKSSMYPNHVGNRNREPFRDEKFKESGTIAEVDTFLNSLKRSCGEQGSLHINNEQLISDALPPSPQKTKSLSSGIAQLELDEVDRLLREVEAEQRHIEAKLSSHDAPEIRKIVNKPGESISSVPDLNLGVRAHWGDVDHFIQKEQSGQNSSENLISPHKIKKPGEDIGSIPDLGFGIRETWRNPDTHDKHVSVPSSLLETESLAKELPLESKKIPILESDHLFDDVLLPKQNPKVFHSRRKLDLNVPSSLQYKEKDSQADTVEQALSSSLDSYLSDTDVGDQTARVRSKRNSVPLTSGRVLLAAGDRSDNTVKKPLLSLANLWSDGEVQDLVNAGHSKLLQKYEEECFRRQHCEHLVQAYQKKLLECQQKLAVALRVDSDKDAAIIKLQGAWRSLVDHWRSLEDQRHTLAQQLQDQKSRSESQVKQMQQKLEHYETELCKALDLAHGYKEQCESAEQIHQSQLEQLSGKVQELERRHAAAVQARAESQAREEALLKQVDQSQNKLIELQAHVEEATKSLTTCEADASVLAEEKTALQTRLKEERVRLEMLQQSKNKIKDELEVSLKRERNLQTELRRNTDQLDSMKTELHDFYQAQLERVVRDKLKEFQGQLDAAESTLQKELESRERSVAQLAARQLQHVTEKNKLEISLLEEKHSEELRLMQLQLAESFRKIKELQARLDAFEKRSSTLAERLHGVMETQWREALNILSSPNDKSQHLSENSSVKMKASSCSERSNTDHAWVLVQQQQHQQQSQSGCSAQSSTEDDPPFSRDGQITHRTATPTQPQLQPGEDIKKYIKMLLERAPGNPLDVVTIPEMKINSVSAKVPHSQSSGASHLKPPWK